MTCTVVLKGQSQSKTLELKQNKVKIGRQTSTKTIPTPLNGYFDSKVLSRTHAELWQDQTKVFIKDLKSSNGTFVNGKRLSKENEESAPAELKNGDMIEFGIDILSETDGSILYHKVACEVYLFHSPISQINDPLFKTLQDIPTRKRKSVRSVALEALLSKLQSELERSKQVEIELKAAKEKATQLDQELNQDDERKRKELEEKLKQAEQAISSFTEKWTIQNQAIESAKTSLLQLEKEHQVAAREKVDLTQQLREERMKSVALEEQLLSWEMNKKKGHAYFFMDAIQLGSIQTLMTLLITIISILLYYTILSLQDG